MKFGLGIIGGALILVILAFGIRYLVMNLSLGNEHNHNQKEENDDDKAD